MNATELLRQLMEYWDNGTPVHPGAMIVDEIREYLKPRPEPRHPVKVTKMPTMARPYRP